MRLLKKEDSIKHRVCQLISAAGQGGVKVKSKLKHMRKVLKENKISNLKHQIPNKSQTSISNDQNIYQNGSIPLPKVWRAGDDAVGRNDKRIYCLGF